MCAQNGQREKTGSFPEAVINEHCTQKELLLHFPTHLLSQVQYWRQRLDLGTAKFATHKLRYKHGSPK